MLQSLLDNSLLLPFAAVLVALLAGLGLYRLRGRMRKPAGETSFLESRLQPDSFFGASGGQRIDTRDAGSSSNSSSMSYSLSQLDAIGDVDPVAEADVYLAYGRDLQAEEILKEAMRAAPERMAIRGKLLEVYAKRRDTKAYELLATQLFNLTRGEGEDWTKAQAMGLTIDPENPLYKPGGAPEEVRGAGGQVVPEPLGASTVPYTAPVAAPQFQPAPDATLDGGLDLDLELDPVPRTVAMPRPPAGAPAPAAASAAASVPPSEMTTPFITGAQMASDRTLDFSLDHEEPKTTPGGRKTTQADRDAMLDFDLEALDNQASTTTVDTRNGPDTALDFGEFSLDGPAGEPDGHASAGNDPLARKLELAEEFRQIGDLEGARDLLEEVVAKGSGTLQAKAQGMLDKLA
jgi:pilus assembly protein FimV